MYSLSAQFVSGQLTQFNFSAQRQNQQLHLNQLSMRMFLHMTKKIVLTKFTWLDYAKLLLSTSGSHTTSVPCVSPKWWTSNGWQRT